MNTFANKFLRLRFSLVLVLAFILGVGVGISHIASALSMPGPSLNGENLRNYTAGEIDPSTLNLGSNTPANPPNAANKPIPNFSAIDTPILTNSAGPLELADDVVSYGILDARQGITIGGGETIVPLYGQLQTVTTASKGSGNIIVDGVIKGTSGTLNVTGNLQLPAGNLQVLGLTSLNGLKAAGDALLQNDLTVEGNFIAKNGIDIKAGGLQVEDGEIKIGDPVGGHAVNLTMMGDADITGTLSAKGLSTTTLSASGDTNLNTLTVNGATNFNSNLQLLPGANINMNGNIALSGGTISGAKIGAYYRLDKANESVVQNHTDVSLRCGSGDIMISCQGWAGGDVPQMQYLGSYFYTTATTGDTCKAGYLNKSGVNQSTWTQAICFNPDMSAPNGQDGAVTSY